MEPKANILAMFAAPFSPVEYIRQVLPIAMQTKFMKRNFHSKAMPILIQQLPSSQNLVWTTALELLHQ